MTSLEVRQFFEAYGASFSRSATDIADFYNVPCITARAGNVRLNSKRADIEAFFAEVLAKYREQGNAQGALMEISSTELGRNSLLATARWAYKNSRGATLWEWTFTYNLYKGGDGWKILLQTMHDEEA